MIHTFQPLAANLFTMLSSYITTSHFFHNFHYLVLPVFIILTHISHKQHSFTHTTPKIKLVLRPLSEQVREIEEIPLQEHIS